MPVKIQIHLKINIQTTVIKFKKRIREPYIPNHQNESKLIDSTHSGKVCFTIFS